MVVKIPLTQGQVALIDDVDADLSHLNWHAGRYGKGPTRQWYCTRKVAGKTVFMHRVIMGRIIGHELPKFMVTDHMNHDGRDNRRANLRSVTYSQNSRNRRVDLHKRSQYKGVCWQLDRNKWKARIYVDGKRIYLGIFADEEVAARAYDKAAKYYFKDYAVLNFGGE